jgi:cytoskeleton protein RodZ
MERIGEKLRRRREELGFTIDDIARATNFRPEMIMAIEDGRPGVFPAEAYLKAFLRAYASKLGLYPQEIISGQKSEEERIQEAISAIRVRPARASGLRRMLVWIGIVALIVVGVLVLYDRALRERLMHATEPTTSDSLRALRELPEVVAGSDTACAVDTGAAGYVTPGVSGNTIVDGPPHAGPVSASAGESAPAELEEVKPPGTVESEEQDAGEKVVAEVPVSTVQSERRDDSDRGEVREQSKEELHSLEVSVSGWSTDVKLLSGGEILFEGTLRPGYRNTFSSTEPFFFDYITNKDAISLLYNGRPVRMPASTGRLVADLMIPPEGR